MTLAAAHAHKTLIATEMVVDMARSAASGAPGRPLRNQEVAWLRALAEGLTIREVAERSAYSEREMFRKLRRLYRKMGVGGRIPALIRASRWGLLD